MPKRLLKYKNYDIHSITTVSGAGTINQRYNANIVSWLMPTDMKANVLVVALYKIDYTIELVRESGILNANLLSTEQTRLIRQLGQQSGRQKDKFRSLPFALDDRQCPYLTEAIGYAKCRVMHTTDAGDHELFICEVLKQIVLNPEKDVMTYDYLKARKLVRG